MSAELDPQDNTAVVATETGDPPLLSNEDTVLLTEARTASWRIQQYEFAYDYTVRRLSSLQTLFDFLAVLLAIVFIYLQVAVPDAKVDLEKTLGIVGTGLSVVLILATIWVSMAQWKSRIERMQKLSTAARELLKAYEKAVTPRPVDHAKIRKWLLDTSDFDGARKDPLSSPSTLGMKRGFQHVGNRNMGRGVLCSICNNEWTHECNKSAKWTWMPLYGCSECGTKKQ